MAQDGISPLELLGDWTLERRIRDDRLHLAGRVKGTAEFVHDDGSVRWIERGTLSWEGRSFGVSRELVIDPVEDGWVVRFTDGRDFHPWTPGRELTHPCRADVYRGTIRLAGDRLRMLWDVTGPEKNLRLVTRCRRRPTVSS